MIQFRQFPRQTVCESIKLDSVLKLPDSLQDLAIFMRSVREREQTLWYTGRI